MGCKRWPGADILGEARGRLTVYLADWRDGINAGTRILAPSIYIFLASLLPALAFGLQLEYDTYGLLGVVQVLAATALCGVTQAVVGGQPLLIVGVAEPIVIIYAFLYQFAEGQEGLGRARFLPWAAWVCVWTAIMVVALAAVGACRAVNALTRFSGELFGALIGILFLQQAVKGLIAQFRPDPNGRCDDAMSTAAAPPSCLYVWRLINGLWSLLLALGLLLSALVVMRARTWRFLRKWLRGLLADYGPPVMVLLWTCISFAISPTSSSAVPPGVPRRVASSDVWRGADVPGGGGDGWRVASRLAEVPGSFIAAAALPAAVIAVLFYFDHSVSSKMAQQPEYNLLRPSSYAYDLALLGVMTLACGLLGLPPVNGVLPQAPMHTRSLATLGRPKASKSQWKQQQKQRQEHEQRQQQQQQQQQQGEPQQPGDNHARVQGLKPTSGLTLGGGEDWETATAANGPAAASSSAEAPVRRATPASAPDNAVELAAGLLPAGHLSGGVDLPATADTADVAASSGDAKHPMTTSPLRAVALSPQSGCNVAAGAQRSNVAPACQWPHMQVVVGSVGELLDDGGAGGGRGAGAAHNRSHLHGHSNSHVRNLDSNLRPSINSPSVSGGGGGSAGNAGGDWRRPDREPEALARAGAGGRRGQRVLLQPTPPSPKEQQRQQPAGGHESSTEAAATSSAAAVGTAEAVPHGGVLTLHVIEQRLSNLLQSLGVAACLFGTPAIRQIPQAVLWGYFAVMAIESFQGSQLVDRVLLLLTDPARWPTLLQRPHAPYLETVPFPTIAAFTVLQATLLAGIWALVTWAGVAGISFPLPIMVLVPLRWYLLPRCFRPEHLRELDCIEQEQVNPAAAGASGAAPSLLNPPLSAGTLTAAAVPPLGGEGGGEENGAGFAAEGALLAPAKLLREAGEATAREPVGATGALEPAVAAPTAAQLRHTGVELEYGAAAATAAADREEERELIEAEHMGVQPLHHLTRGQLRQRLGAAVAGALEGMGVGRDFT